MAAYTVEAQNGNFAARLQTDDLQLFVNDQAQFNELVALLDKYMVVHIAPHKEMTKQVVGDLAFALGYPKERRNPRNVPPEKSAAPGYEFVADFGSKAKPNVPEPRIPSYIESLHYDGISSYSVQANFNVPPTTPNLWADMRAAYRDLPRDLRKIVDKSFALHAVVPPPNTPLAEFPSFDAGKAVRRPLVIKHFRTKEPLLYLPKNSDSKIEGMSDSEGREVLHELWSRVNTSQTRFATMMGHNQLVIWDGLGTTHTNPAYPRDKDRTTWFFIIPSKSTEVEHYFA